MNEIDKPTSTNKANVTIIPIGSSSSGNSIYVRINDVGFLIDAGICLKRVRNNLALKDYSVEEDINAVFVSHSHSDHISHINKIIYATNNACLYSTAPICTYLKDINRKVVLSYNTKKEVGNGLYVTAFKTSHDAEGCCGFVYEKDGIKVASLTDTGVVSDKMLNAIKGSHVVIIESNHDIDILTSGPYPEYLQARIMSNTGHLSNDQCAKACRWLVEHGTKHFLLAHLSEENNLMEEAYRQTSNVLKKYDADVYVLPKYDGEIQYYKIN